MYIKILKRYQSDVERKRIKKSGGHRTLVHSRIDLVGLFITTIRRINKIQQIRKKREGAANYIKMD